MGKREKERKREGERRRKRGGREGGKERERLRESVKALRLLMHQVERRFFKLRVTCAIGYKTCLSKKIKKALH